jgi:hypothetical protein
MCRLAFALGATRVRVAPRANAKPLEREEATGFWLGLATSQTPWLVWKGVLEEF